MWSMRVVDEDHTLACLLDDELVQSASDPRAIVGCVVDDAVVADKPAIVVRAESRAHLEAALDAAEAWIMRVKVGLCIE